MRSRSVVKQRRRRRRVVLLLLLAVVLQLGYVTWFGFPGWVNRRVEAAFAERGYAVRIGRMHLRPEEGVVAGDVHWWVDPAASAPWVSVGEMVLEFRARDWWRGRSGLRRIQVLDASVAVDAGRLGLTPAGAAWFRLEQVQGELLLEADAYRFEHLAGRMAGMVWVGRGRWARPAAPDPAPREPLVDRLYDWFAAHADALNAAAEKWAAVEFVEPPMVQVEFLLNAVEPVGHRAGLAVVGGPVRFRGVTFDGWRARAGLSTQRLQVPELRVWRGADFATVRVDIDLANDRAEAWMEGLVSALVLRNVMPPFLRQPMDRARINFFGPVEMDLVIGPSPLADLGQTIAGRVAARELEAHGVWLERVQAQVRRDGDRLEASDIDALVGRDAGQGPATGAVQFDLSSGHYSGQTVASFDPQAVLPVAGYSETAAEVIQSMVFDRALPTLDVVFSGRIPPEPRFHFEGDLRGEDFVYRGSRIQSFDSRFLVTNRVMRIDPLYAVREEGRVEGWYQQDFNEKLIDMDLASSVDPRVLGRIAGGAVATVLLPFRFEGPVELSVRGRVDYATQARTAYRATGRAQQVGWRWLLADWCELDWEATGQRIALTNVLMQLYGGSLEGDVLLEDVGDPPIAYSARGALEGVSFPDLLRDLRQTDLDLQTGDLSGTFEVRGLAEPDWEATLEGGGRLRIRDGEVFRVRLLGGLTELLARVYPALGSAVQTDVRSDFRIADRRVSADDIRFEGNVLSLQGWGSYHLDDQLDFKVQVQPLRRGLLVDIVRLATFPVSRLLQFRLEGTLHEPEWKIDRIPRDWQELFEGTPVEYPWTRP